jgi:hypothetical protein
VEERKEQVLPKFNTHVARQQPAELPNCIFTVFSWLKIILDLIGRVHQYDEMTSELIQSEQGLA